jgi:tetratricopeptide (TPR) repeat protein
LDADRLDTLRALAAAEPEDPTTQFLLGRELLTAGLAAEAAGAFRAAIAAHPDYAAAWRQLGNALEADGRADEAAEAYRAGIVVAEKTHDLQAGKEMNAFLKRLAREQA